MTTHIISLQVVTYHFVVNRNVGSREGNEIEFHLSGVLVPSSSGSGYKLWKSGRSNLSLIDETI